MCADFSRVSVAAMAKLLVGLLPCSLLQMAGVSPVDSAAPPPAPVRVAGLPDADTQAVGYVTPELQGRAKGDRDPQGTPLTRAEVPSFTNVRKGRS